ncbi:serine O-acetyltransferase [Acinetobacter baumannii]|uniref:serine O-acetyltransferase n=1 Tax=Acinetobacter baumannii TaxID=470 RepID=UPI00389228B4
MLNAIFLYRISHFLYKKKIPFLPLIFKYLIFLIFNSVVPYSTKIGKNTKFAYGGIGVVLHSRCIIGDNCIIGQGITIGRKLSPEGIPTIGNDVYIAAGSRILGGITIGNNVIIGANAVVVTDIPDNSIVAGAPAKVVRTVDKSIYDLLENIF